jgi:hypothetical protein
MEHIWGFTQNHWMPPLVECLRRIAPSAAMVVELVENTYNTNKTQLLPSNYRTFPSQVICENVVPQNRPSTQLINAKSCVKMCDKTIGAEVLAHISSYHTFSADKNWESYLPDTMLI